MSEEDEKHIQFMTETVNSFDVEHVGIVYILGSSLGYYKVGFTTNLYKRFTNFGVKLPFEVWLEHAKIYFDCAWAEKFWHYQFDDKRVNGEWFRLNKFDLDKFHYSPSDLTSDAKLSCLYNNSNSTFWESEQAKTLLENYSWKVAYKKAALKDFLDSHLTQPEITRQYLVRKRVEYNATIAATNNSIVFPEKES
jgi:hypothetical protein